MRCFKEPAIAPFGDAERLLRARPVAGYVSVWMIVAHDSFHSIFPAKSGMQKPKTFGGYGVIMCRKTARPPYGVHPMPELEESSPGFDYEDEDET